LCTALRRLFSWRFSAYFPFTFYVDFVVVVVDITAPAAVVLKRRNVITATVFSHAAKHARVNDRGSQGPNTRRRRRRHAVVRLCARERNRGNRTLSEM